jgi:beta-N-acetylhexosaminidase
MLIPVLPRAARARGRIVGNEPERPKGSLLALAALGLVFVTFFLGPSGAAVRGRPKPRASQASGVASSTGHSSRRPQGPRASSSSLSSVEKQWVTRWTRPMSVADMAAQLIFVAFYGDSPKTRSRDYRRFARLVHELGVGGMLIINRPSGGAIRKAEPYAAAAFVNRMQRLAKVPLMLGGDFERGPSMRMADTTSWPHNMTFGAAGDLDATRRLGAATAREARAMGYQLVFAPVSDVNNNPDNPIINIRSYGENPEVVAAHVRAYIEGAHSDPRYRVLVTAKHFPGHGDTSVDSHLGLGTVTAARERLDKVEFVPFRAAIAAGVDAIMTAHLAVPALEPEPIPATISSRVLTGVLRDEFQFKGLVITDAMDMQGLASQFPPGEAAVRALLAGADVLLMPHNPDECVKAIVRAVEQGRLSRERLQASVNRLLAAKVRVGLHKNRLIDIEGIGEEEDPAESEQEAQQVADKAVTMLKNDGPQVPLADPAKACFVILAEGRTSIQGRAMMDELRSRAPAIRTQLLDPLVPELELEQAVANTATCGQVVIAAFANVVSYRGSTALAGEYTGLVQRLTTGPVPVTFVALGNPYLLRTFPGVAAYLTTFSSAPPCERAAVKALLGAMAIRGHTPVTIPGFAQIGDGIQVDKRQN